MKYPWVSISIIGLWLTAAYIILQQENVNIVYILVIVTVATIILSIIGLRPPKEK